MRRFRFPLGVSVTIAVGLVTLLGLTLGGPLLGTIAGVFINLALATAAMAVLAGVANLFIVHMRRVGSGARGWFYSLALVISMFGVIGARIFELTQAGDDHPALGSGAITGPLFTVLQLSIEGALSGLMAFFLIFAAARMMRRRVSAGAVLFIGVVILVLLGWQPLPLVGDVFGGVRDWIVNVPAAGGLRGILIGMALGALTVGVRVLVGRDQPYRG
ncbi:MAG: hypothetical protein JXB47_21485 [Anaerolineae bacterium]|nr:hypothetical protein [Anaerolineae bacterium]